MNSNMHQRPAPSSRINGSFGPYSTWELEAARAELIESVYGKNGGGILKRVKLKCGILANQRGDFEGAAPHPVTNVSFESQSCSIMSDDPVPWIKQCIPPQEDFGEITNGNNEHETSRYYQNRYPFEREHPTSRSRQSPTPYSSSMSRDQHNLVAINTTESDSVSAKYSSGRPSLIRGSCSTGLKRKEQEYAEDSQPPAKSVKHENSVKETRQSDMSMPSHGEDIQKPSTSSNLKREMTLPQKSQQLVTRTFDTSEKNDCEIVLSSDHSDEEVEKPTVCFKCDLCVYTAKDMSMLMNHLQNSNHYTASKYLGVLKNDRIIPKFLDKQMVVMNNKAKYRGIVPVCPTCHQLFSNIHSCYTHSQMKHQSTTPVYGLGHITRSRSAHIFSEPICHICMKKFMNHIKLRDHMKKDKHHVYGEPQSDEVIFMICTYCSDRKLFTSQYEYHQHLREIHGKSHRTLDVMVNYVHIPPHIKEMLPRMEKSDKVQLFQGFHNVPETNTSGKKSKFDKGKKKKRRKHLGKNK